MTTLMNALKGAVAQASVAGASAYALNFAGQISLSNPAVVTVAAASLSAKMVYTLSEAVITNKVAKLCQNKMETPAVLYKEGDSDLGDNKVGSVKTPAVMTEAKDIAIANRKLNLLGQAVANVAVVAFAFAVFTLTPQFVFAGAAVASTGIAAGAVALGRLAMDSAYQAVESRFKPAQA